jgi:hypothetical protein
MDARSVKSPEHDFGAEPAQVFGALVLAADQGAYLMPLSEKHRSDVAANGTDRSRRSRHEDRPVSCGVRCHVVSSVHYQSGRCRPVAIAVIGRAQRQAAFDAVWGLEIRLTKCQL